LEIDLPQTTAKSLRQQEEPLVVTISDKGQISLGKIKVNESMLYQQLNSLSAEKKQQPLYLRADKSVPYGVVVSAMAEIKRAGFEKLGMITQPSEKKLKEI